LLTLVLLIASYFVLFAFIYFCYSMLTTLWDKVNSNVDPAYFLLVTGCSGFFPQHFQSCFLKFHHRVSVNGEITHMIFHKRRNDTYAPPYQVLYVRRNKTREHPCPEKIMHKSFHIQREIYIGSNTRRGAR
jgi:hypothetical protein